MLTDPELKMTKVVLAKGLKNPQMKTQDKEWSGQEELILGQKQIYQQVELH